MLHQTDTNNPGLKSPSLQLFPIGAASSGAVAGVIEMYGGTTAPSGYVLCDGSTYDGTNPAYQALWLAIGTNYGGTGQSAFKVPDMQGRVPVGKGTNSTVATLGNNDGQILANRSPRHSHTVTDPGHTHGSPAQFVVTSGGSSGWQSGGGSTHDEIIPQAATNITVGTGTPGDAPAYIVVNYIIKL